MIKKIFKELAEENNYSFLEEKPLIREDKEETFFIGSAIMANMEIFNVSDDQLRKYYTIQRIFSATRLEDIGHYPLATPFEISLSIFRVNDSSVEPSIEFVFDFLKKSLNINSNEMIYLAPHELNIRKTLINMGIDQENIISWDNNIPLNLGKNEKKGVYLKMFIKYKHGIAPLATLGYVEENGLIKVDSALFLERLDFVKEGLLNWYEGIYFRSIINEIEKTPSLAELEAYERYAWANHLRSLVILYFDGLRPSGKGKGHIISKITRYLASTIVEHDFNKEEFYKLVLTTIESLNLIGYESNMEPDLITNELYNLIQNAKKQIKSVLDDFVVWISNYKETELNQDDIFRWRSEKGLSLENIKKISKKYNKEIKEIEQEKKFWFRNECYSFNEKNIISNPVEFIRNSETKRMRGVN